MGGTTATLTVFASSGNVPRAITLDIGVIDPSNALSGTMTTVTLNRGDFFVSVPLNTVDTLTSVATVTVMVSDSDPFTTITDSPQTFMVTPLAPVVPPVAVIEQVTFTVMLNTMSVTAGETATLTVTPLSKRCHAW